MEVRLLYNHLKGIQNTVNIRKNFAVPRIIGLQTFLHGRKTKIQAIHGVVLDKIRLAVLRLRVKGKIDRQSAWRCVLEKLCAVRSGSIQISLRRVQERKLRRAAAQIDGQAAIRQLRGAWNLAAQK